MKDDLDSRPRVEDSFAEPDEQGLDLLVAIGRAVIAAAGLEKALQLELARALYDGHIVKPNPRLGLDLSKTDDLTAGQLLRRLRELNFASDLAARVGDAIERRNRLVHHTFEDPELAQAIAADESPEATIARIDQLAIDCAALAVELQIAAVPGIEKALGKSRIELVELVNSIDPSTISDPNERVQLEAVQALGGIEGITNLLNDLVSDPSNES